MKNKDFEYTVTQPGPLLPSLLAHMKHEGRNAIKSMLARGQVYVDGQPAGKHDIPLQPGQKVTVRTAKIPDAVPLAGLRILHEDEHLIAVHKDSGLLSVAASPESPEPTAYRQLTAHVRVSNPKARIWVVHRLDRDTSGVMIFAKSEDVKVKLQAHWNEAVEERTYVALVEGEMKQQEGIVRSWLKETKTLLVYSSPHPNDGQLAVTHYKVLESNRDYSLVELQLETGRKNQIRVHMQDLRHPVVGDKKYGAKRASPIGRLGLHARSITFSHPATGESVTYVSNVPSDFMRPFRKPPQR